MTCDFYDSSFNGYPLCQSLDDPAVPVSAYPTVVTRAESTTYTDKKGVVSAEVLNAMPLVRQAIPKLTEILNFTPQQRIDRFDAYLQVRTITKDEIKRQDGLAGLLGT